VPSIVVIEDERILGKQIARALQSDGHEVHVAETGAAGIQVIHGEAPDLVLLDLRLPDEYGLEVLTRIREHDASIAVILMTAHGTVADAVEAMRRGASDYLQKPLDLEEMRLLVERVLMRQRRERELAYHRQRGRTARDGVIGESSSIAAIFQQVERLATARIDPAKRPTVLLTGETGTGKGVLARAIHEMLGGGPFIEINCTAMPESLIEAELFGHERGTFTDAKSARTGLFEAAEGGTVFLDEIGHAPLGLQAKLLKLIEEKRVRRLGSTRDRVVNAHVISATNRDLDAAAAAGEFRSDLLHRLRVLSFEVPPLRERGQDPLLIARHFCSEIGQTYGRRVRIGASAELLLTKYPWPGNVRELRNLIERAILLGGEDLLEREAFAPLLRALPVEAVPPSEPFALPVGGIDLAELEQSLIRQALERTEGNRTRAAALLGLSRDTLRYRLEKFGLE
jgi:DNA-binding NtrC family response regulator